MKSTVITMTLVASAAFAAGGWYFSTEYERVQIPQPGETTAFNPNLAVEDRIAALERAVSDERQARQLLQEEVFYLTTELEMLSEVQMQEIRGDESVQTEAEESRESRRAESRRRNSREGRIESLIEAGFLPSQANWITQREQEMQMEALQARFDAERSGEPVDWMNNRNLATDTMREELGDADYERYLEANNRSTNVAVSSIIESSPAQIAGLQPGDEIFRYDGERVFSMTDLTRQTMIGEPGQNVAVDVMRNGMLIQVVMPRGPVGITGGRRRY
jgi:TolA-binding protein